VLGVIYAAPRDLLYNMHPLIGLGLFAAAAWLFSKDKDSKMPAVQKQFEDFHAKVKLDDDDEKAKLREKRETLLRTLKANLGDDVPTFEKFDQGSYAMHTGVVPLGGNYDIDVGLIFDCKRDKYSDPVELKKRVRDALDSKGRTVVIEVARFV
jgi:predicted Rdx family selenoprotein